MIEQSKDSLKDRKLTKFIFLGEKRIRVVRPKGIIKLSDKAEIYGDSSLKLHFDSETLEKYQDNALLILRKKKKGEYYTQQLPPKWFDDSRVRRLAGAILWEQTFKEDNVQKEADFMKSELQLENDLPYEALKHQFLTSKLPSLRIKDIKRLIQLWEQHSRKSLK